MADVLKTGDSNGENVVNFDRIGNLIRACYVTSTMRGSLIYLGMCFLISPLYSDA